MPLFALIGLNDADYEIEAAYPFTMKSKKVVAGFSPKDVARHLGVIDDHPAFRIADLSARPLDLDAIIAKLSEGG